MAGLCELYNILGIKEDATETEVKKAYHKASLRWHPDKNPNDKEQAEAMFKKIAEAYTTLSDPIKKALYGKDVETSEDDDSDPMNVFDKFFEGLDPFADLDRMFSDDFFSSGLGSFADKHLKSCSSGNENVFEDCEGKSGFKAAAYTERSSPRSRSPRKRIRKKGAST